MKYYIDYHIENGKILGFLSSDTLKYKEGETIEVSEQIWTREADNTNNNRIIINNNDIIFDKFDLRTEIEKEKDLKILKWDEFDTYIKQLKVSINGHEYSVNDNSLVSIERKINHIGETSVLWVEDWGQWQTDKTELEKVLIEAEKLKQDKLNMLFGS